MSVDVLEHLPPNQERLGTQEARRMVGLAFAAMEPQGDLYDQWEGFGGFIHRWAFHDEVVPVEGLWNCRQSLDKLVAEQECGDLLIAGAKLGLSAIYLAASNPSHLLIPERSLNHDDLTPLVYNGLACLWSAKLCDPPDPTVRLDLDFPDAMQRAAMQVEGQMQRAWLQSLLDRAVRPQDG